MSWEVRPFDFSAHTHNFKCFVKISFSESKKCFYCLVVTQSGAKVSISATPFENTSIKVGPARKTTHKSKMARRNKKTKNKEGQDRWEIYTHKSSNNKRACAKNSWTILGVCWTVGLVSVCWKQTETRSPLKKRSPLILLDQRWSLV